MASPIFASFFIKKYVVQFRSTLSDGWKEYESYRRLDEAKEAAQKMMRQNPKREGRIINRLSGEVIHKYLPGVGPSNR